jgi:hypothetical protein
MSESLGSLLRPRSLFEPEPVRQQQWLFVTRRFKSFQDNLTLAPAQVVDGQSKVEGVVRSLNRWYWSNSTTGNFFYAGSWAKSTAVRPPNDIDILYVPPVDVYHRFNQQVWNGQSALLQGVKDALRRTYPQTQMRGDGQVVVVGFNSISIEVVPAFPAQGHGFLICETSNGGRWKHVDAIGEFNALGRADEQFRGNVRKLTRIIKQWKRHCLVPIKSFHIEQLVIETLQNRSYGGSDEFWFDWLVRDVFAHMVGRADGWFSMPGLVVEQVNLGSEWIGKAETAHRRAVKACEYERSNMDVLAGLEWQKIFGTTIPSSVTWKRPDRR